MPPPAPDSPASLRGRLDRVNARLTTLVGRGLPISLGLVVALSIAVGVLAFLYLNSAPPTTLTSPSSTGRSWPARAWR